MSATVQVTIRILDKDYQVACPEEERQALLDAARNLHARMKEIRDGGKVVGVDRIAVMAALNMSHELLEANAGRGAGAGRLHARIQSLQEKVGQALERARREPV